MVYTVKQLANLAGVSPRTLHYYDEIGLLRPSSYGENGYRYYGEEAALRLQQILFFREMDLSLNEIQDILDRREFDVLQTLQAHRQALQQKVKRLNGLICTVDKTIMHLRGKIEMSTQELFEGFDEEKQKHYEQEASARYGDEVVKASIRRWNNYTAEQKTQIGIEGETIYRDLLAYIGQDPASKAVQQIIARWHQYLRYFYEPSRETLLGLAQGYSEDPAFRAVYEKMHPDMPEFIRQAIVHYCQEVLVHA